MIEDKLAAAVIRELVKDPAVSEAKPRVWDAPPNVDEQGRVIVTQLPRVSVKVNRPNEEAIFQTGIYDLEVIIKCEGRAITSDANELRNLIEERTVKDFDLHTKLSADSSGIECCGCWFTGTENTTDDTLRERTIKFAARCVETA